MKSSSRWWLTLSSLCLCFVASAAFATNAPSNLAATGISSSTVSLTWTDNSSNEIGFTFMFDTSAAFTNPTYVWAGGVNTTSYTHSGRNPATTYYYKIKAEGNPDSSWTGPDSATTAPSNPSVTPTSNSALSLSWTGNTNNVDIHGYTYAYATNSSFTGANYVWVAGNGATSATRTGLSTATTYWLKIKAEGTLDGFDSPYGSVVTATTMPASLSASVISSSQINLSWSGNAGNSGIVGYTVAKATTSSFAGAAYHYVNGAGATSFSSTGLLAGTTYYYKVKAEGTSDAYDSPFTGAIPVATSNAAPNPPSNLAASVISSSRVDLSWTDNSTSETGFELKRATDSAFTQNVVWIGGIAGTSYSNTGLTASTTYHYKVRAQGTAQHSAYSSAVSATTSAGGVPMPPGGLTASAVSNTQVNLSWTDNSNNETGFELKRATDGGFTQNVVWIGNIQGTTYSNVGLNTSTTYYYKVRAEGTAGKSTYSNTANVTTPGNPPPTEGVPISPRFFGVNAWMPYRVGSVVKNGQLDNKWPDVQNSRARSVRYGGIAVDEADPAWVENDPTPPETLCPPDPSKPSTMKQYADMVDAMRAIGAEPILQVPVLAHADQPRTAQDAADIVRCINITLQKGVEYWSIGNEPDLAYGWNTSGEASNIAAYMRSFASAMKAVDSTIKIVGPETAWFNWNVLDRLTNGGPDDILDILDVISFHMYGWPDGNGTIWPNRGEVISYLMADDSFHKDLILLKDRVAQRNAQLGRTGDNALKMAVTEANINWENPSNDSIDGVGAKSFMGGQFWAEVMGIAMQHGVDFLNFWSVIEGNNVSNDKGYLCRQQCTHGAFHPSYHHFQMMATHFRGNALLPADGISFDDEPNVKSFAAKDSDQIAVIVLNQDASASFDYIVRLNTDPVSASLKVNIPVGLAAQITGTIANQSTILLVFDAAGTLKRKIEYKRNPGSTPTLNDVPYP